jgi:hypothetical protein
MPYAALDALRDGLAMCDALANLESQYDELPSPGDRPAVYGLRGAVCVLAVAAFERFVRDVALENARRLPLHIPASEMHKLPAKMRETNVFGSLDHAMKGPPSRKKLDRLPNILTACEQLSQGKVFPERLVNMPSNPNAKNVRELLKPLGVDDVFGDRHVQFVAKWGTPVPQTFMTDKLDEIVDRRHGIAHTGRAEGVARSALAETTRFLGTLGELVEETVSTVMTDLLQAI